MVPGVVHFSVVASLGMGIYANNFKDLTTTFTAGSTVSGDLVVAIAGVGGYPSINGFHVNDVRLTAGAVPEPMALGVLGVSAAGLLA